MLAIMRALRRECMPCGLLPSCHKEVDVIHLICMVSNGAERILAAAHKAACNTYSDTYNAGCSTLSSFTNTVQAKRPMKVLYHEI